MSTLSAPLANRSGAEPSAAGGEASARVDPLDVRDSALIARLLPFMRASNRRYLRLRVQGFDRLP